MVRKKSTLVIFAAIALVAIMILSGLSVLSLYNSQNSTANRATTPAGSSQLGLSAGPSAPTAWTYPTNTYGEPGYTNGTYKVGVTIDPAHLNIFQQSTVCDFLMSDEIYDNLYNQLPNGTFVPWLATSYTQANTSGLTNHTTFDPLTGAWTMYNLTYTVNLRSGVQWTDWTAANASATYTYSNTSVGTSATGKAYNVTYTSFSTTTMKTYYVQSADVILSWLMMSQSTDFNTAYQNVVNIIPLNNLTVEFMLSGISTTFTDATIVTPILPYHIWQPHSQADIAGIWNYNSSQGSHNGYNNWNLSYNAKTGYAPGLVGTGPYRMVAGSGGPSGVFIAGQGYTLYVNPTYFIQYTTSTTYPGSAANGTSWYNNATVWRQFTPKVYADQYVDYSTVSATVTAMSEGLIDNIELGVPPSFIPVIKTFDYTYIFEQPQSGYGYQQLNSFASNAPFNITAFRQAINYATNKAYLATVVDSGFVITGIGQTPLGPTDPLWRNASTNSYFYNPSLAESMIGGIPGMTNNSGQWYYNGNPVTADIQITSSGPNPLGVAGALVVAQEWAAIGIPTTVTQESFATVVTNLCVYNYNVINLGLDLGSGDPTQSFLALYNYNFGYGSGFWLGPWSSLNFGGVQMTGAQVNNTLNNLTIEMTNNPNLVQRIAISNEIQGIGVDESTIINFGYGVSVLPYYNAEFTNISEISIPYTAYMFWQLMTVHKGTTTVVKTTSQYLVSVALNSEIYYPGQSGTATITVKSNLTNAVVSGATVQIGMTSGAALNVSNTIGTTNSNGVYSFNFVVPTHTTLVYAAGYMGLFNVTVVAYDPANQSVKGGLGYATANVLPNGVKIVTSSTPTLVNGGAKQLYTVEFENATTGAPLSGFGYMLSAATGAITVSPAISGQTVATVSTYDAFYGYSITVQDNGGVVSNDATLVSGVTGSNGTAAVWIQANSSYNYTYYGQSSVAYLYLGNIATGGPVAGSPTYLVPSEWANPNAPIGGAFTCPLAQMPVDLPVQMVSGSSHYSISLSVSNSSMSPTGSITVTATVTNSTGAPVSGYALNLWAQDTQGFCRGYFTNSSGTYTLIANPNYYAAGSEYFPALNLVTGANGVAKATFSPGFFAYTNLSLATSLTGIPYPSEVVPFAQFVIGAIGATGGPSGTPVASKDVSSSQRLFQLFNVTFSETGLPSGSTWSVMLSNGATYTTSNASETIALPNGTYTYTLSTTAGRYMSTGGSFTVNGASVSKSVTFSLASVVTFTESGLPSGSSWTVTLNNAQTNTSTSTSLTFTLVNGTYTYTVTWTNTSYNATSSTGSFTVSGSAVSVNLTFTKVSTPSTSSSNNTLLYIIVGVVVAVIVIGAAVALTRRRGPPTKPGS